MGGEAKTLHGSCPAWLGPYRMKGWGWGAPDQELLVQTDPRPEPGMSEIKECAWLRQLTHLQNA